MGKLDCGFLEAIAAIRAEGAAAVVLGYDCSAPPLPATSCLRVNLLDITANMQALEARLRTGSDNSESFSTAAQPKSSCEPEDYYDLSTVHRIHLETPRWIDCSHGGKQPREQTEDEMKLLSAALKAVTAGQPFLRGNPAADVASEEPRKFGILLQNSILRGGCTFVLDPALMRVPQDAWAGRR